MTHPDLLNLSHPHDGVALITLNRPDALNALSMALREALVQALHTLAADPATRVVVDAQVEQKKAVAAAEALDALINLGLTLELTNAD